IRTEPRADEVRAIGHQLADALRPATGYPLPVVPARGNGGGISLLLDDVGDELGPEGYRLDVTKRGVTIRANEPAGLFAGTQTLRQLLPAAIESDTPQHKTWTVPGGGIRSEEHTSELQSR